MAKTFKRTVQKAALILKRHPEQISSKKISFKASKLTGVGRYCYRGITFRPKAPAPRSSSKTVSLLAFSGTSPPQNPTQEEYENISRSFTLDVYDRRT
jgi:hypothetical protein